MKWLFGLCKIPYKAQQQKSVYETASLRWRNRYLSSSSSSSKFSSADEGSASRKLSWGGSPWNFSNLARVLEAELAQWREIAWYPQKIEFENDREQPVAEVGIGDERRLKNKLQLGLEQAIYFDFCFPLPKPWIKQPFHSTGSVSAFAFWLTFSVHLFLLCLNLLFPVPYQILDWVDNFTLFFFYKKRLVIINYLIYA